MKVAILSMQRVYNYGSYLQAYSLKRIIEGMGHQVEFIDIIPGRKLSIHENYKNEELYNNANLFRWLLSKCDAYAFKTNYT